MFYHNTQWVVQGPFNVTNELFHSVISIPSAMELSAVDIVVMP